MVRKETSDMPLTEMIRWPTSAKNNVGINEAVNYLLDIILNTSGIDTGKTTEKNTIDLSKNKTSNKSSSQQNECAC